MHTVKWMRVILHLALELPASAQIMIAAQAQSTAGRWTEARFQLNLNTASAGQLELLPAYRTPEVQRAAGRAIARLYRLPL